ncbi:micronuclear linker histone polyprotein-like [Chironomus tepperi]|uniref:micronuclear linker histone polyprotein-like n=1 Tax=Chironomus tepperi TaxID=113505 RepID=UPI00391F71A7
MSSTQQTLNQSMSIDDMLVEIPESSVYNNQNQVNNDHISDSDESSENFEPVKLKFIRKFAKSTGKISKNDLEELLLQKITESMIYRTKYAEIRVKLDMYEELIQRQQSRIELLEKQYSDLEVTHARILTAMRENPQVPIEPLKIVRSVSCQVYSGTEYVNLIPDPIVIGDSPKKNSKNDENLTKKGSKKTKNVRKITIDSSDNSEDLDENSNGRKQDVSKENDNSGNKSSIKHRDSSNSEQQKLKKSSKISEKEPKNTKKSCKTQANIKDSSHTTSKSDLNPSNSKNNQLSSKLNSIPTENENNSSKNSSKPENKSSKVDKISTSNDNSQQDQPKRSNKRKASTILEMFGKRVKSSEENTNSDKNLKENGTKNSSKSTKDSDSDEDVTLIEDDDEEPMAKRSSSVKSSSDLNVELMKVFQKMVKVQSSKLNESSSGSKMESKSKNTTSTSKETEAILDKITSKIDNFTSKRSNKPKADTSKTDKLTSKLYGSTSKSTTKSSITSNPSTDSNNRSPKSSSSSSPEPEDTIPIQKSFKVPTTKPKIAKSSRPGPKCSKKSTKYVDSKESSHQELKVSDKLLNGTSNSENPQNERQNSSKNPQSASKVLPSHSNSAKKSPIYDQSYGSLNLSSSSNFDTLSSFKSADNLVTSTPLKEVDQGPTKAVKRILDMNFYENTSCKVPKLPLRGPQMIHPKLKELIPSPTIKVEKVNNGIRISWKIDNFKASDHADIESYQIYVFEEIPGNDQISSADWKLVGNVKAMLLPMAVTLRDFNEDQRFHFAIRAVDIHKRLGDFSESKTWL